MNKEDEEMFINTSTLYYQSRTRPVANDVRNSTEEKKRETKFAKKKHEKEKRVERSAPRENCDGIDVTELVVSNRDSRTGKRFKVFSTIVPHQYGIMC